MRLSASAEATTSPERVLTSACSASEACSAVQPTRAKVASAHGIALRMRVTVSRSMLLVPFSSDQRRSDHRTARHAIHVVCQPWGTASDHGTRLSRAAPRRTLRPTRAEAGAHGHDLSGTRSRLRRAHRRLRAMSLRAKAGARRAHGPAVTPAPLQALRAEYAAMRWTIARLARLGPANSRPLKDALARCMLIAVAWKPRNPHRRNLSLLVVVRASIQPGSRMRGSTGTTSCL